MFKVEIVSSPHPSVVEERLETLFNDPNMANIAEVQYSTAVSDGFVIHCAAVFYEV